MKLHPVTVVGASGAIACLVACAGGVTDSTFCSSDGPESTTALILDTSDPLAPHQVAALERFTESLVKQTQGPDGKLQPSENYVAKGHLLVVYELAGGEGAGEVPLQLFRMCNPGSPEERGVLGGLTEGETIVMLRWSEFRKKIDQAFPDSLSRLSKSTSPIIETIRYVRNKEFLGAADITSRKGNGDTILIVSDLLQNSDLLSHYRGPLPPTSSLPQLFALDLTGIEIGVRYLRSKRDGHLQTGNHFAWWRKFFAEAGGPMTRAPESW